MRGRLFSLLRSIKYKFTRGVVKGWRTKCLNVSMAPYSSIGDLSTVSNSLIGRYSSIGRNANIHNADVGSFCSISWNVTIGATSHPMTHPSTHAFPYVSRFQFVDQDKRIINRCNVGADVWVGANVIILPGITIGNGAVIGAGSVVTKDVPPYSVVAGSPARQIKLRFSDELISELETIKWWEWDVDKIKDNLDFFQKDLSVQNIALVK
jgi:acetyltransferase-like isoleucine patch superfamily enzyme